ncbi:MAG: ABC transporter permease [Bryobacteraceae bacterium]
MAAGGRTSNEGATRPGLRNALVAAEVAITIVVLVASGLLIRSFGALLHVDPGFRPDHVLTMQIGLPDTKYSRLEKVVSFYRALFLKTGALPGVERVASITPLPFTNALSRTRFAVEGKPLPEAGRFPVAQVRTVTTGYFDAFKIPLRQGRYFTEADMNNSFAIINESLARRFFPDQNPIGQRILMGVVDPNPTGVPVVGVVCDTREIGLNTGAEPELYFPGHSARATLVIRTTGEPLALAAAVRQQVLQADREQPVSDVRSIDQVLGSSLARQRFAMLLLTLFSGLGLLLAAVGLYGVMSYSVAQRTHEMGLRLALGAGQWDIFRLVLKHGMGATAIGVGVGVASALTISRFFRSLLYGVSATDPPTYIAVCGLLGIAALIAIYIPARRALRVDPVIALRWE